MKTSESMILRSIGRYKATLLCLIFFSSLIDPHARASDLIPRHSHIRTAAIQYWGNDTSAAFIGRHYDISVANWNPTLAKAQNPNMKIIVYGTLSSLRDPYPYNQPSNDTVLMKRFIAQRRAAGGSPTKYNYDSMFLYATQPQTASFSFGGNTYTYNQVAGQKLQSNTWGSVRQQADFTQPSVWEYVIWKSFWIMDSGANHVDGIMEDEAYATRDPKWDNGYGANYPYAGGEWTLGDSRMNNRWDKINPKTGVRYTDREVRDSLRYLQNHVWMKMLGDSLNKYNRFIFPNSAAYGVVCTPACTYWPQMASAFPSFPGVGSYPTIADVKYSKVGVLYGEGMVMSPTYPNYLGDAWQLMDSLSGPWAGGMAIFWYYYNQADETSYGLARTQMFELAHYYMAANPNNCYFLGPNKNFSPCQPGFGMNDYYPCDTVYRWFGAIEADIGIPTAFRAQPTAGVYTRKFSKGFVVWNSNSSGSATVNLPQSYRPVNVDGSLGTATATTTIPFKTGQIFLSTSGGSTDSIPPGAITNLLVETRTSNSVTLTWTAPGDDGMTGTATQYDMRYSANPITSANFGSATQAAGEPTPKAAGGSERFMVTGLAENTLYYFAIKTADEVPNWSTISNVVSATTMSIPPGAITNLLVETRTFNSVTLTWTAPGDDGMTGTATQYDMRYSASPITSANFDSATQAAGEPTPKAAGGSERFMVTGLVQNTLYYFAIKTADEVPNWSAISNIDTARTTIDATPDVTPPDSVTDLGALPGDDLGQVVLSWVASGDDHMTGILHHYEIRSSTFPIGLGNWLQATFVSTPPPPVAPGLTQTKTVSNLTPGELYYFGVMAYDEAGNSSLAVSPAGFAKGILSPSPVLTDVDSLTGSVTVTASTVPSYLSLSYEFALDSSLNYPTPLIQTVTPLDAGDSTDVSAQFNNLVVEYKYFWCCRAVSRTLPMTSDWSQSVQFDLSTGILRALVDSEIVVPTANQVFLTTQPTFEVTDVAGVSRIYFQVDDNESFVSPISSGAIATTPGSNTNWQITEPLAAGGWFVRASSDNLVWTKSIPILVSLHASSAVEDTHAYPNPYRPVQGNLTFSNMPLGSNLVIFTVGGEIITRMDQIPSPVVIWDGRNLSGHEVSSGIYLWQVDPGNKSGKILVIR